MNPFASDLLEVFENSDKDLVVLSKTTHVTPEMHSETCWEGLGHLYIACNDKFAAERAVVSVLNSAVTQGRIVFAISRKTVKKLLESDPNWTSSVSISDRDNPKVIALLTKKHVREVQKGKGMKPSIYEIIHPVYLELLSKSGANRDEQLAQAEAFVARRSGITKRG